VSGLRPLTGKQRYAQLRTKARIIDGRNLRAYLAGTIPFCPCSVMDDMITKEFDRLRDDLRERVELMPSMKIKK
jgi:hypothetical protein